MRLSQKYMRDMHEALGPGSSIELVIQMVVLKC